MSEDLLKSLRDWVVVLTVGVLANLVVLAGTIIGVFQIKSTLTDPSVGERFSKHVQEYPVGDYRNAERQR
jgi:hypothetical protein